MNRRILLQITVVLLIAGLAVGCGSAGKNDGIVTGSQTDEDEFMLDGPPNHDDIPDAEPLNGTFASDHGTMTFNGDGESVSLDLDQDIAQDTGLPEGASDAKYCFYEIVKMDGYLKCDNYNTAEVMRFTVGEGDEEKEVYLSVGDGYYTVKEDSFTLDLGDSEMGVAPDHPYINEKYEFKKTSE